MTNNQIIKKLSQDIKMKNFSHYTYDSYMRKTKEMIEYFNKSSEQVIIEKLRDYLYKHLLKEN